MTANAATGCDPYDEEPLPQDAADAIADKPAKPVDAPAETDGKGRRIVTVKGKRYLVGTIIQARPGTPEAYVWYWSERNGETFGATRSACASQKPGTVGRAIWDAVNR